ncbi:hypothetical protein [Pseudoalteromonas mariniglutinosa]|uniref:hypothetical protein n=1 Tax=Pseudoalteromonas mariniglutinosa TaxID=206042 RepID=UPI00384D6050
MYASIRQLNARLQQHQLQELVDEYPALNPQQQAAQLQHLYLTAAQSEVKYLFLQNVASRLLQKVAIPLPVIAFINDLDKLSFFTPGLKFNNAFSRQDEHGNTLLHYLFSQCEPEKLPFNYLRSLMLFESNEGLPIGLKQLNQQHLSAIGCFIVLNSITDMPEKHQFSALLAMMEVDQIHSTAASNALFKGLKQSYSHQTPHAYDCKVVLAAAYLQLSTEQVLNMLS